MSDEMNNIAEKSGETCSFWDCGNIKSPFWRDHVRAPGEPGICIPIRRPCELDIGHGCGLWLEATQTTLQARRKNLWRSSPAT